VVWETIEMRLVICSEMELFGRSKYGSSGLELDEHLAGCFSTLGRAAVCLGQSLPLLGISACLGHADRLQ
jgi:hypothetical protein